MPNLIATPRSWAVRPVVLKNEVTYGTDALPTGADDWFEARNVTLSSFEAETVDRNVVEAHMGAKDSLITSIFSKLSFEIGISGSGAAGTAPPWARALLACAFAETVTPATDAKYNLVSALFGSATAGMEIDGVLYKLIGSRGNVKCNLSSRGIGKLIVDLTSLYTEPTVGTITAIDKTGWQLEEAINSVNTGKAVLNGINLAFSALEWDLGSDIKRIDLPGPQREVRIAERNPTAKLTVLAPTLATFNPYALAKAGTVVALTTTHGTTAGNKFKQDLNVKVMGVQEIEVDGMVGYDLTLKPRPVVSNDEIALTCL